MMKTMFAAALLGLAFTMPAYAEDEVTCDDASITKLQADIDALEDAGMKAKAMETFEMAKTALGAKNVQDCITQMQETRKRMTKG